MTTAKRSPWAVCAAFCLIYVLLFCWLGRYACPSADDYAFSHMLKALGFWNLQSVAYQGLHGRPLFTFLVSLAYSLPLWSTYPFFPGVTLILYAGALYTLLSALLPHLSRKKRLALTLLTTAASLAILPYLNETLYWMHGGILYFWSRTLLLLSISLGIKALKGSRLALWLCFPAILIAGTLSELTSVAQGIVAFLAMIVFYFSEGRRVNRRAWMAGAFWLASVAAFLVMYLAPGTAARMGTARMAQPFLSRLALTLLVSFGFGLFTAIKFLVKPIVWAFLLFLPDIAASLAPGDGRRASRLRAWHILLLTVLTACLMESIGGWAQGSGLELRGESLIIWMMGAVWACLWAFGYRSPATLERIRASRLYPWRRGVLALCLLCSANFVNLAGDLETAPRFAAENRTRSEEMSRQREAGVQDVVVPWLETRPRLLFFSDLRPWSSDWKNECYASYHGVKSVYAPPTELLNDSAALEPLLELAERGTGDERAAALWLLMGELYDPVFAGMKGAPKDAGTAMGWYERAARAGSNQACRRLTRLCFGYDRSSGHYLRAVYWFLRYELTSIRL